MIVECSRIDCLNRNSLCENCRENKVFPTMSFYQSYIPTCPYGYDDCISDPAYIKYNYPNWYKELYGDKTVEEAGERCRKYHDADSKFCDSYDDEDK